MDLDDLGKKRWSLRAGGGMTVGMMGEGQRGRDGIRPAGGLVWDVSGIYPLQKREPPRRTRPGNGPTRVRPAARTGFSEFPFLFLYVFSGNLWREDEFFF